MTSASTSSGRQMTRPVQLRIAGDAACFTRPELKTERVSYPVMTPSAARGVLEAVFWKPEIRWEVTEIAVLRPISWWTIRRNELRSTMSAADATRWAAGAPVKPVLIEDDRDQRNTLALRDVAYRITAHMVLEPHAADHPAKYREQALRRIQRGQCFNQPYLGCREFSAAFGPADDQEEPHAITAGLGRILWGLDWWTVNPGEPPGSLFFDARLEAGVMTVPSYRDMIVARSLALGDA